MIFQTHARNKKKTMLKEIKEFLNKCGDMPCSGSGDSINCQTVLKMMQSQSKIPVGFFCKN